MFQTVPSESLYRGVKILATLSGRKVVVPERKLLSRQDAIDFYKLRKTKSRTQNSIALQGQAMECTARKYLLSKRESVF